MGFLDSYGGAANAFTQNLLAARGAGQQHRLEREKLLLEQQKAQEQAKLQAAHIQAYMAQAAENQAQAAARIKAEQQQAAFSTGYADLYKPRESYGMMGENIVGGDTMADLDMNAPKMTPGNPTAEQRMAFTRPFLTPQQAMQADVTMAGQENKLSPILAQLISSAQNGTLGPQGIAILEKMGYGGVFSAKQGPLVTGPGGVRTEDKPGVAVQDINETWSDPYAETIGGKKALVQKSNRGQVRTVIQDTSTTNINMQDPGAKLDFEASKTLLKSLPKLKEDATIAANSIQTMKTMVGHVEAGDAGALARLKGALAPYAAELGYNAKSMSDAQTYQLLAKTISGSMRMAIVGPGQVSNYETQLLQSISGGGTTSAAAAKKLFEHYTAQARLKVDSYNRDVDALAEVSPKAGKMFPKIKIPGESGQSLADPLGIRK